MSFLAALIAAAFVGALAMVFYYECHVIPAVKKERDDAECAWVIVKELDHVIARCSCNKRNHIRIVPEEDNGKPISASQFDELIQDLIGKPCKLCGKPILISKVFVSVKERKRLEKEVL